MTAQVAAAHAFATRFSFVVSGQGRPIRAGAKVRILSVSSCARGLPNEDQSRLRSYEGQLL